MSPQVTRTEHYQIMLSDPDSIGYCHKMWELKTGQTLAIGDWLLKFKTWTTTKYKIGPLAAVEIIFKHFQRKFA